jgi:hypothetical protein
MPITTTTEQNVGQPGHNIHERSEPPVRSSAGLAARPSNLSKLVAAWKGRAAELKRDGESEQAGIYLVCAVQLESEIKKRS